VRLEVIPQLGIPVAVSGLNVRSDPGRQTSHLRYAIKNNGASRLHSIHLLVVFFNDRNEPLGGESLSENVVLSPDESRDFTTALRHYVEDGQRVAVAVTEYATDAESWRADHTAVINAMKQQPIQ
jgi:hypothetical protein